MLAIYINAGNNSNGNPRRGWIITDGDGDFADFVNEGYGGKQTLREAGYSLPSTPPISVTPGTYRNFMRSSRR